RRWPTFHRTGRSTSECPTSMRPPSESRRPAGRFSTDRWTFLTGIVSSTRWIRRAPPSACIPRKPSSSSSVSSRLRQGRRSIAALYLRHAVVTYLRLVKPLKHKIPDPDRAVTFDDKDATGHFFG